VAWGILGRKKDNYKALFLSLVLVTRCAESQISRQAVTLDDPLKTGTREEPMHAVMVQIPITVADSPDEIVVDAADLAALLEGKTESGENHLLGKDFLFFCNFKRTYFYINDQSWLR
jgi:hypothetical protein